jgi:hypothetical protein
MSRYTNGVVTARAFKLCTYRHRLQSFATLHA